MSRRELTNGVWVVRAASWAIWSFIFSATGIILYLVSGQAWPIYTWVIVGLIFMCYFSPRLKPYEKDT